MHVIHKGQTKLESRFELRNLFLVNSLYKYFQSVVFYIDFLREYKHNC